MKKTLSLILTVMMLLGCMTVPALAKGGSGVIIGGYDVAVGTVTDNDAITGGTVTFANDDHKKLTLDNATIVGDATPAISANVSLEIELAGNNTLSTVNAAPAISVTGNLTFSGTGTLIAHGGGSDTNPAILVATGTVTLPEGYKAVGSTSTTETDISKMTEATFSTENTTYMVGEAKAQTVAIIPASSPTSGTTDITAIKAASFSYEIVFPTTVPTITAAGAYAVGQAKVTNVQNATDNTVISYTATTTDFKLSTDNSKTMAAYYYTEETATNAFPTDAVTVYANKADAASIPTMWVKIAESDWNAADAGTYTATVTFNFTAEEEATKKFETVGEVLGTVEGGFPTEDNEWQGDFEPGYDPPYAFSYEDSFLCVGDEYCTWITYETSVSESQTTPGDYVVVKEGYDEGFEAYMAWTITFHMTDNVLTSIAAKLDYYANSSGEKTQDLTTYNLTNIKPVAGEPV